MFIGFWGSVFISLLLLLESSKSSSKIIGFWGSVFISLLLLLESSNFDQDYWDMSLKFPLLFLTLALLPPTYLAFNQKSFLNYSEKGYLIYLCFILLYMVFWVDSLWMFFIFFELSVIPILLMISSLGGSKSRMEASKFLFIFTSGGSLILLFFIVFGSSVAYWEVGGWLPHPQGEWSLPYSSFSFFVIFTFFIKMPSLFVHMWLPKAHVEAPVFGSMVLASVMLKMGGYGILFFSPVLDYFFSSMISPFLFMVFSLYSALVCYSQKDLKILIAYSSVNHMALVLLALMVGWSFGFLGGVILMMGHGVVSSILFFLSSGSYNNTSSRSLVVVSSSGKDYFMIIVWVMFTFINMGFPPFVNFLGEVYILKMMAYNPIFFFLGLLNFFIVGLYGVLMISNIAQSKPQKYSLKNSSGGLSEFLILSVVGSHLYSFLLINLFKGNFYV